MLAAMAAALAMGAAVIAGFAAGMAWQCAQRIGELQARVELQRPRAARPMTHAEYNEWSARDK
jgi:hypothetical protein